MNDIIKEKKTPVEKDVAPSQNKSLTPPGYKRFVSFGLWRGAEGLEDRDGGEGEAGDDRRRAEQIPDVFRDFRLAFHGWKIE